MVVLFVGGERMGGSVGCVGGRMGSSSSVVYGEEDG